MATDADASSAEQGVLAVLAGTPLADAAALAGVHPTDLADAVETYRAAGQAALHQQSARRGWRQLRIQFPDQHTAEQAVAANLGPRLRHAEAAGLVTSWWFIRKPQWRLRCHPGRDTTPDEMNTFLENVLNDMRTRGQITAWANSFYEPESGAFGGTGAMAVAHDLFHQDSRSILDYLARPTTAAGRRELSILLCGVLMKAAGQDWYECGDIWARVAAHRPVNPAAPPEQLRRLKDQLRQLMTVDLSPDSTLVRHGRLQTASEWIKAFEHAGKELGNLARDGCLDRGIRSVLAHHILFHWNRLGIPSATQATLAQAAQRVVMDT